MVGVTSANLKRAETMTRRGAYFPELLLLSAAMALGGCACPTGPAIEAKPDSQEVAGEEIQLTDGAAQTDSAVRAEEAILVSRTGGDRELPPGPLGETIRLGEQLVAETATHPLSAKYVGNSLNCTSCHLDNGTHEHAASFIGVATAYPAWAPREQRVITLEDRILNCFMRSCNGTRPPLGSNVSVAIAAYITWLSSNQAISQNAQGPHGPRAIPALDLTGLEADVERGKRLYRDKCADCHMPDGTGSTDGPPVWGPNSFNHGAGLSKVPGLAKWLKVAMPLDQADLSDQEAYDIAAYINSYPRLDFRLEEHLPPADQLGQYNGVLE
jgi:thiosulfate dehydrogenase